MNPLISCIVPVYNVEKYISTCITSLTAQTYPNFEIILVDDGSPDSCPAICDEYAVKYKNIRVLHQENKGLSGARNAGMAAARGEWFVFIDSDDSVAPDLLSKLYALQQESGAKIVSSGVTSDKPIDGIFSSSEAIEMILKETANLSTSACGKLFSPELFSDIRFPEGLLFEDYATIPLLFDKAGKIIHTGEVLYHYRNNDEGITHSKFSDNRMEYFTVSERVEAFLTARYPKLLKYAKHRRTRCAIAFYKQWSQAGGSSAAGKELVKYTRKGILPYLFTSYKLTSKAYGLLIAVCPPLAAKLFQRN